MLKAKEVLERAAFDVGDEYFQVINRKKMLVHLERAYRTFCTRTKLVNSSLGINLNSQQTDYPLSGVTELGTTVGGNILELYRVEYNNTRIFEVTFEDVMNARIDSIISSLSPRKIYATRYFKNSLMLYLPFIPSDGDQVVFWYVKGPLTGFLDELGEETVIEMPDKFRDNLSPGLALKMYDTLIMHYGKTGNTEMVKYLAFRQRDVAKEWTSILEEGEADALRFKEQITPIMAQVPSIISPVKVDMSESR